jgi:hypothetical protein
MKIVTRSGLLVIALAAGGCGDLENPVAAGEDSLLAAGEADPGVPDPGGGVPGAAAPAAAAPITALTWAHRGTGKEIGAEHRTLLGELPWIIGPNEWRDPATGQIIGGCYQVYRLDPFGGLHWEPSNGCGKRISVERDTGIPWIVNHKGEIWYLRDAETGATTGAWIPYNAPCVSDIAAGYQYGKAWAIGCDFDSRGNATIYNLSTVGALPDPAGRGVRIAWGPSTGRPWMRTAAGIVYRRTAIGVSRGSWQALSTSGRSRELAVGLTFSGDTGQPNGERVWVVNRVDNPNGTGSQIQYLDGTTWYTVNGAARNISARHGDFPWVINNEDGIFQAVAAR